MAFDITLVYPWMRQTLGLSANDSTTVANADLQTFATSEVSELVALYPCTADVNGSVTLAGNDLTNFYEAAGLRAGARFLLSPSGNSFAAKQTKIKVGPVEEDYGSASPSTMADAANIAATKAIMRVACVKAGMAFIPLAEVNGFRRTQPICPGVDFGDGDIDILIVSPSVNPDFLI